MPVNLRQIIFVRNDYMKKNQRFIIPVVAIVVLALAFGVMYIINHSSGNDERDNTENVSSENQTTEATMTESQQYKIGVMQFDDSQEYTDVYDEFVLAMEHRGFSKDVNVEYIYLTAEGDGEKCSEMAKKLVDSGVDLIFAISEENAVAAYNATKDIPIVFGAVNDPEEADLIDTNEVPGANVTGVSDYSPSIEQMDLIKSVFPDAKTVGAVYDELNESSVTQIALAETQANTNEMTFEKYPVNDTTDFESYITEMVGKVDVIYLPYDELLIDNIDKITSIAYEKGIPVVGGNEEMVQKGCALAYGIDYADVGKQSALMAVEILQNDGTPADMPVRYLNELILYVNTEAQEKLGFELDETLESKTVNLPTKNEEE